MYTTLSPAEFAKTNQQMDLEKHPKSFDKVPKANHPIDLRKVRMKTITC